MKRGNGSPRRSKSERAREIVVRSKRVRIVVRSVRRQIGERERGTDGE